MDQHARDELERRAAVHAALAEPLRLAIVDELAVSDRSPTELGLRLGIGSNLLSHHLDVLEAVGLVVRSSSAGDRRRKYVRLDRASAMPLGIRGRSPRGRMLFLCTQNSARSQLAAALWSARTGRAATSAGTAPAAHVHPGAVAAARRAGVSLREARPRRITSVPAGAQVVTVCDLAHEELLPTPDWWHWSIPDPVAIGTDASFDAVVAELEQRITAVSTAAATSTDRLHGSIDT
jgi:protein-tyrosine-phosphatase/DNA-binding HxlR family transcriptional regulator